MRDSREELRLQEHDPTILLKSCGRNWLDRWVERYIDEKKNAKILEVDTGKPGPYVSRTCAAAGNHHHHSLCSMTSDYRERLHTNDKTLGYNINSQIQDSDCDIRG
jgi:hypothetical protein